LTRRVPPPELSRVGRLGGKIYKKEKKKKKKGKEKKNRKKKKSRDFGK
jgi:hypothetical protein